MDLHIIIRINLINTLGEKISCRGIHVLRYYLYKAQNTQTIITYCLRIYAYTVENPEMRKQEMVNSFCFFKI